MIMVSVNETSHVSQLHVRVLVSSEEKKNILTNEMETVRHGIQIGLLILFGKWQ